MLAQSVHNQRLSYYAQCRQYTYDKAVADSPETVAEYEKYSESRRPKN